MERLSSIRALRRALFTTSAALPIAAGAFIAMLGAAGAPTAARAADVVCTPNASGTAITSATEACSGVGDRINYASAPATVTSTITLSNVTISGTFPGVTDAVAINPGTNSVTILGSGGSITAIAGDGIDVTATAGTGTINVGTAANRLNIAITGGAGVATAQGILVNGRGDVNLYTGLAPINGSSTGGGSWSIIARNTFAGSNPGGAVLVDALGPMTAGRGGILATTTGTDVTDTVTVITAGAITGLSGAGIQTSSVNGNSIINALAPVIGSVGAGQAGISQTVTGAGNASLTTGAAATVQGTAAATGVIVSSGAGGMNVNLGAGVASATGTAIRATSSQAAATNTINLATGAIRGGGLSTTTSILDLTSQSGGRITVTTGAGTAISSNSATTTLQNADLAIKGTGGSVTLNNAGSIRGVFDFSPITVATNGVTFNNTGAVGWQTTATTNFSAGNDTINNTGLVSTNGATTLAFGGGSDAFNNNAGGIFAIAQTAGASITTLTGLEAFNNAGTINLQDGVGNDVLQLGTTAYVGSGSGRILIDAALGAGAQASCAVISFADCVVMGAASGTTTVTVTDTNTGAGALDFGGQMVIDAATASATSFVLGGANVTDTPQGPAIVKGLVQYQLVYDAAGANALLVATPSTALMQAASFSTGQQALWRASADGWSDRAVALRHRGSSAGVSVWGKAYYAGLTRDASQSLTVLSGALVYDTSYEQSHQGVSFGADVGVGGWVAGLLAGYATSTLEFDADGSEVDQTAWSIGAYGSYVSGQTFLDLLVKADFNTLELNSGAAAKADGDSVGFKATVGHELSNATSPVAVTPQASLSYVHTSIDELSDGVTRLDFDGARSMRASVGVRIDAKDPGQGFQPFGYVGVGYEFSGANAVDITSGFTQLRLKDTPAKAYGEASVGFNFVGENGFTGFAAADGLFGDDESGWGVKIGFRIAR